MDEVGDVCAGGLAGVRDRKHLSDLGEGQPGRLCMADEAQTLQGINVIVAISRWCANRIGEETLRFPETDGLRGDAALSGKFPDAQAHSLDLPL